MLRIIIFTLVLWQIGCHPHKEKDVIITKDYVINPNWDRKNNRFDVKEMKPKDGSEKINPAVTSTKLLNSLIEDEESSYGANVKYNGKDYSKRKVYFNKKMILFGIYHAENIKGKTKTQC